MSDFSRFESRRELRGVLHLLTPVRIGAQRSNDVSDVRIPLLKDTTGNPVIPGSSLKGVMRAYIESMLRAVQYGLGEPSEQPFARVARPEEFKRLESSERVKVLVTEPMTEEDDSGTSGALSVKLIQNWKEKLDDAHAALLDSFLIEASSVVQGVFGAPWVASKVYLRDAMPVANVGDEPGQHFVRSIVRDGVAIDRDRRVASDKLLYSYEAIPAGTLFDFCIVIENATPAEMGVLMLGIQALQNGEIGIGGGRSRGLGSVKLELYTITEVIRDDNDLSSLLYYLAKGEAPVIQPDEKGGFDSYIRWYVDQLMQFIGRGNYV